MSKKASAAIVKMVSTANTGFFYTTRKSRQVVSSLLERRADAGRRLLGKKLLLNKYDPVVQKHVLFKEEKISRTKR